jgi:hypothetical protein
MVQVIDVHVQELRKRGYRSLAHWLENPAHLYCGRHNHYVEATFDSKWANPYPVGKKYSLAESLALYEKHLTTSGLENDLEELEQYKELGCWCITRVFNPKYNPQSHIEVALMALHRKRNEVLSKTKNSKST